MAMQTDFLTYRLTIGLSTMEGRGFYYPCDTVIGHDHRLYVLNRSLEGVDRGIRVTMCDLDSEYYGTFGSYGEGDGQFVWPSGGAVDAQGHIYITDEYLHRVTAFDASGTFWPHGGRTAVAPALSTARPASPAMHKATCTSLTPTITASRSSQRAVMPSSVLVLKAVALDNAICPGASPWVRKVTCMWRTGATTAFSALRPTVPSSPATAHRDEATVSSHGPASVAVDPEGYMYIADWGNERVQVLDPDGGFVQNLRGEATLSVWAVNFLNINKEEGAARARANLEPEMALSDPDDPHEVSSHIEKYFWSPMSVKLDDEGQLYVTESNRHRIQIYGRTA